MSRCNPQSAEERFWSHVDKRGPDECWPWTASLQEHGYGQFNVDDNYIVRAHRFSYELHYGPLNGRHALHSCDNPKCVNPKHLFRGTHYSNMKDMTEKGRRFSRLSEIQVKSILLYGKNGWKHKKIAEHFCISRPTVTAILNGRIWAHVS